MSNEGAISEVTHMLRDALAGAVASGNVTMLPPDRARGASTVEQLNLFLFHAGINPAWRNQPTPGRVVKGESATPPVPLDLHYLVTAYGADDEQATALAILGSALRILHDTPLLAIDGQAERIRVTPSPLSIDEMHKLWTAFQTSYRPSFAYQVSVVLIESHRGARTPLPVARRGEDDRGVASQPDLLSPLPLLEAVEPDSPNPAARMGDRVVLSGRNLAGTNHTLVLRHVRLDTLATAASIERVDGVPVAFRLPAAPNDPDWASGIYSVSLTFDDPANQRRTTADAALQVAPTATFGVVAAGKVPVGVEPPVRKSQRVTLLLGDRELAADAFTAPAHDLKFTLPGPGNPIPSGTHWARLRIDGVDSFLVDRSKSPLSFDSTQTVVVP